MGNKKNKTLLFGALSAVAASVAAGIIVKNKKDKENKLEEKPKEKKSKNIYYTVSLNDIYSPYDDTTFSEEDMINEIKKETSY